VLASFHSFLFGSRYRYAPISPLYVFGRLQDIGLQKAVIEQKNPRLAANIKSAGRMTPLLLLALIQCASTFAANYAADNTALARLSEDHAGINDGRGRFREIFCTVLEKRGNDLPDYRSCEEALSNIGEEPPMPGIPVNLGHSKQNFLIGLVPGLAWQCVRKWLDEDNSAPLHVAQFGFDTRLFEVGGLTSPVNNARQIRDYITALPPEDNQRPIILVGHSKGTVDILQALVSYPEVRSRVVAVVSLAGAVGGSPLAKDTKQSTANLLAHVPGSGCETGDEGAMASLHTETRKNWLKNNPLPKSIRYFSVITIPDREHVSIGLRHEYKILGKIDARNDGQLLFYDQFIPGATLLAFANADHWAMSIPVARQLAISQATLANKTDYPREALFESILRFVEEDLAGLSILKGRHVE